MCGQPGPNTRLQVRLSPSFLGMDDLITKLALIRKLCESLMCLAYFLTCYSNYGCLYNRALANVLSTGGGIKCLCSDCQRLNVDWRKIAVGMFHTSEKGERDRSRRTKQIRLE